MSRLIRSLVLPALVVSVMVVSTAGAADQADQPITDAKQSKLLEKFGGQGIDANEDGVLSHDEVKAFFADKHGEGTRGCGKKGRFGHGEGAGHHGSGHDGDKSCHGFAHGGDKDCHGFGQGRRGPHGGQMRGMGMALPHLEMLAQESPPEGFSLAKHAEADADGDGELSSAEWRTFADAKRIEILARLAQGHPQADTDGDGTLNDEELEAFKALSREHLLDMKPEADTNGDGVLSDDEARAFHESHMEEVRTRMLEHRPEADLDGDGVLSDDEMHQAWAGRKGHGCTKGKGCPGWKNDLEHRARALEHHPEADLDGDGELSDDELKQLKQNKGCRGGKKRGLGGHGGSGDIL